MKQTNYDVVFQHNILKQFKTINNARRLVLNTRVTIKQKTKLVKKVGYWPYYEVNKLKYLPGCFRQGNCFYITPLIKKMTFGHQIVFIRHRFLLSGLIKNVQNPTTQHHSQKLGHRIQSCINQIQMKKSLKKNPKAIRETTSIAYENTLRDTWNRKALVPLLSTLIINNYSTSARWIWVAYNHLSGIVVLLKMPTKYGGFFPTLFVKTIDRDVQFAFNFEQTRTATIIGEHCIMAHIPW